MLEFLKNSNTVKALNKVKAEFLMLSKITDYILQVIFICFYGYSIYANLENKVLLIINVVLLVLAILYLLFTIFKDKLFKKDTRKVISRFYRYSKLLIRLFTVGLSVYEIMEYKHSDLQIIITAVTVISWFIQVLIEVARFLLERYIDLIQEGIKMDIELVNEQGGIFKMATKMAANHFLVDPVKEKVVEPVKGKATNIFNRFKERKEARKLAKANKKLLNETEQIEIIDSND